jgi:hypothetical protein
MLWSWAAAKIGFLCLFFNLHTPLVCLLVYFSFTVIPPRRGMQTYKTPNDKGNRSWPLPKITT